MPSSDPSDRQSARTLPRPSSAPATPCVEMGRAGSYGPELDAPSLDDPQLLGGNPAAPTATIGNGTVTFGAIKMSNAGLPHLTMRALLFYREPRQGRRGEPAGQTGSGTRPLDRTPRRTCHAISVACGLDKAA